MTGTPSPQQEGPQEGVQGVRGTPKRCSGVTKAGKPCKSTAVLEETGTCLAHAPQELRGSRGFGGPQPGSGRPRSPRAVEVLRQKLEAQIDDWWQVLEDARSAERGLVVGDGPSARIEYVEDHSTRLKAFHAMFDRAIGKPMQFHDVTTREEESEVDREIADLLAEMDRRDRKVAR